MDAVLKKSNRKDKKFMLEINNKKTIHFGQNKSSTFIDHHDNKRKENYIARHKANENWNKLNAGALSRFVLWESKTLDQGIKNIEKKFNLNIQKKIK